MEEEFDPSLLSELDSIIQSTQQTQQEDDLNDPELLAELAELQLEQQKPPAATISHGTKDHNSAADLKFEVTLLKMKRDHGESLNSEEAEFLGSHDQSTDIAEDDITSKDQAAVELAVDPNNLGISNNVFSKVHDPAQESIESLLKWEIDDPALIVEPIPEIQKDDDDMEALLKWEIPKEPDDTTIVKPENKIKRVPAASHQEISQIHVYEQRMQEYKAAAINFKKAGNLPKAREMLAISKSLQPSIELLSAGQSPASALPPPPSEMGSSHQIKIKSKTVTKSQDIPRLFSNQAQKCISLAAEYLKADCKEQAIFLHKLNKRFLADEKSNEPVQKVKFTYEQISQSNDLQDDEIELSFSIQPPFGHAVTYEFSFGTDSTLTSSLLNSPSFTGRFKFTQKRALRRSLERRKLNITISRPKTALFGLVPTGIEAVARASVSLAQLTSLASVEQKGDLLAPNSRKVVGTFEMTAKVQGSSQATLCTLDWICVGDFWQEVHVSSAGVKTVDRKSVKSSAKEGSYPAEVEGNDTDTAELEMAFKRFALVNCSPENIVSNHVLETEYAELQALAATNPSEELADTLSAYQLRMTVLVTLAQSGALSMPEYIQKLQVYATETKQMAIQFKTRRNMEFARKALKRFKLVEIEIQGMQE